jgi:hypothetical protein
MSDSAEKTHSQSSDLSLSQVIARIERMLDARVDLDVPWEIETLNACLTLLRQTQHAQTVMGANHDGDRKSTLLRQPQAQGNDQEKLHECDRIRLLQWGAKCDEPAKPEAGPMRNAESPSGVQALGSSGLAQAITDITNLRDGARNIESSSAYQTDQMWLWRGKAIAYETVLGRLSRVPPQAQGWQPEDVRTVLRRAEQANKDWRWALDQLPLPSPPAGSQ